MLDFVLLAVSFVLFLIAVVVYIKQAEKKITTVPGLDPTDPVKGNLLDIGKAGSLHQFVVNLHERYGNIARFWLGPTLIVSIASPTLFKENSKIFDRPAVLFELTKPIVSEASVQFANGADGQKRHATIAKCFSTENMQQHYETFNKLTKEVVTKWRDIPEDEHVSLQHVMFNHTITTLLQSSFGVFFEDNSNVDKLAEAYQIVFGEVEKWIDDDIPETDSERWISFQKELAVIKSVLNEAQMYRMQNPPNANEYLLIDAIIESDLPKETIVSDILTVYFGGIHTTALFLTWAMYYLATHKDVQHKLFIELGEVLGDEEEVTSNHVKDLMYLDQVTKETLRCSVLAPYAARIADTEIALGGHKIPAGTPVLHALGRVLKDVNVYPEPEKFDPERFSPENIKRIPHFGFEPFGFAGKRKCPAFRFSNVSSSVLLASILKDFEINLVEGQDVTPVYGFVTKPKEDIWITIKKRP